MFVTNTTLQPSLSYDELATLKHLAINGGTSYEIQTACSNLSDELGISAQTASRRLQALEQSDCIHKKRKNNGMKINITESGVKLLKREYEQYRAIFEDDDRVKLSGVVCSGSGKGKGFIQLDGYMLQFEEKLGYSPYPGTFNVELSTESIPSRQRLTMFDKIQIEEWDDNGQTYGSASCYPATVSTASRSVEAHVLEPDRTHHGEQCIEFVAPQRLRGALDVSDGDKISIKITSAHSENK